MSTSFEDEKRPLPDSDEMPSSGTTAEPPTGSPLPPEVPALDAPDGGLVAWLQVLGTFIFIFDTWGLVNSYGSFQTIYEGDLLRANSPSAIAWIGSIQAFILLLCGCFAGPLFDMGYFRSLEWIGSFLVVFGLMMTSISTKYYQILPAQGVCVGLGASCLFIPSLAVLTTYFKRRRAFAIGTAASGSGVGGVVFPAILRQLEPKIGFGWATRIIGFIVFGTLFIAIAVMRRRPIPTTRRKLIQLSAWKETPYTVFTFGLTLGFMGTYIPFYYISSFAAQKTGASSELAFYFVPILNAASVFGRIFPNMVADRLGAINTLTPCAFVCTALVFAWIAIGDVGGLATFAVLYGFFVGTFVSLAAPAVASLTDDLRVVGTRLGMSFACAGVGILVGNPIAGALIDLETGEFVKMQVFCGVIIAASGVTMAFARVAKVGTKLGKGKMGV
ncbi:putative MFS monocarboxylate transporter [Amylostereum chailletii]|nr:putative MFS monocarboxylate transporter [Amylostereum chailletii]